MSGPDGSGVERRAGRRPRPAASGSRRRRSGSSARWTACARCRRSSTRTGTGEFEVCRTLFDFLNRNLIAPAGRGATAEPERGHGGECRVLGAGVRGRPRSWCSSRWPARSSSSARAVRGDRPAVGAARGRSLSSRRASCARGSRGSSARSRPGARATARRPRLSRTWRKAGLVDRSYLLDPWRRPFHYEPGPDGLPPGRRRRRRPQPARREHRPPRRTVRPAACRMQQVRLDTPRPARLAVAGGDDRQLRRRPPRPPGPGARDGGARARRGRHGRRADLRSPPGAGARRRAGVPPALTTPAQKAELLEALGVDVLAVLPFDAARGRARARRVRARRAGGARSARATSSWARRSASATARRATSRCLARSAGARLHGAARSPRCSTTAGRSAAAGCATPSPRATSRTRAALLGRAYFARRHGGGGRPARPHDRGADGEPRVRTTRSCRRAASTRPAAACRRAAARPSRS